MFCPMISLRKMKELDPELEKLSDAELEELRRALYETAQLAFEVWWSEKQNPRET